MKELDLMEVLGDDVSLTHHCDSRLYYNWEVNVAIPLLKEKGYKIEGPFYTLEGDSFGPLSRGIRVSRDGTHYIAWYG